jgi:hypothetical protein
MTESGSELGDAAAFLITNLLGSRRLKLHECIGLWSGRKGQTGGSPSQETHGTGNCKGYALSVPGFSRQAAPTRIAFHSNPVAQCKGEVLDTGNPPLACKKFLDENEKAAAESELERRFREFEAEFWGLRFKCETTSWVRNPPAACKSSQFSPPACWPARI